MADELSHAQSSDHGDGVVSSVINYVSSWLPSVPFIDVSSLLSAARESGATAGGGADTSTFSHSFDGSSAGMRINIIRNLITGDDEKVLVNSDGKFSSAHSTASFYDTILISVVVVRNKDTFCATDERDGWYLPAGRVEYGETFDTAARRQTVEEAGLEVELKGVLRFEYGYDDSLIRLRCIFEAEPMKPDAPLKNSAAINNHLLAENNNMSESTSQGASPEGDVEDIEAATPPGTGSSYGASWLTIHELESIAHHHALPMQRARQSLLIRKRFTAGGVGNRSNGSIELNDLETKTGSGGGYMFSKIARVKNWRLRKHKSNTSAGNKSAESAGSQAPGLVSVSTPTTAAVTADDNRSATSSVSLNANRSGPSKLRNKEVLKLFKWVQNSGTRVFNMNILQGINGHVDPKEIVTKMNFAARVVFRTRTRSAPVPTVTPPTMEKSKYLILHEAVNTMHKRELVKQKFNKQQTIEYCDIPRESMKILVPFEDLANDIRLEYSDMFSKAIPSSSPETSRLTSANGQKRKVSSELIGVCGLKHIAPQTLSLKETGLFEVVYVAVVDEECQFVSVRNRWKWMSAAEIEKACVETEKIVLAKNRNKNTAGHREKVALLHLLKETLRLVQNCENNIIAPLEFITEEGSRYRPL